MKPGQEHSRTSKQSVSSELSQCDAPLAQAFLICVTIHKASFTALPNADTFVEVSVDRHRPRQTVTVENSDTPFFNDYFTFECHELLAAVLSRTVRVIAVRKTGCTKRNERLGEFQIEMQTVWSMKNHAFHKKWVPLDREMETIGFVQMDLSLLSKKSRPVPAVIVIRDYDIIEENLLMPTQLLPNGRSLKIKCCINIYSAYLMSAKESFIRVQFAGVSQETRKLPTNKYLEWNEQIVFMGNWPSMCQTIRIEVIVADMMKWKSMGNVDLHLSDMSFSSESPFPTLGPTYVQLYHPNNARIYLGRILLSVNCQQHIGEFTTGKSVLSIPPMLEPDFWRHAPFNVSLSMINAYHVHSTKAKLKVRLRWSEKISKEITSVLVASPNNDRTYVVPPSSIEPMTISLVLPDVRHKFAADQIIDRFITEITGALAQMHLINNTIVWRTCFQSSVKDLLLRLSTLRQMVSDGTYAKKFTEWDTNRNNELKRVVKHSSDRLDTFLQSLRNTSPVTSAVMDEARTLLSDILKTFRNYTQSHVQNGWPVLFLEFLVAEKVIAVSRLDPSRFMVAPDAAQINGRLFGKRHFALVKPISCDHSCDHCGCLFAIADLSVTIVSEADTEVRPALQSTCTEGTTYQTNVFVHQAKLRSDSGKCSMIHGNRSLRISMGKMSLNTSEVSANIAPIWNEKIPFCCSTEDGGKLEDNPPPVFVELMDRHQSKTCANVCLGNAVVVPFPIQSQPSTSERSSKDILQLVDPPIEYQPNEPFTKAADVSRKSNTRSRETAVTRLGVPLRWIPLYENGERIAEVLLSIEILTEENMSSNVCQTVQNIPRELCPAMREFKIDVTFVGLRNWAQVPSQTLGKFKIEVSLGDVSLISGPSSKPYGKSVNLLDPFKSGYVNLPELIEYWPSLVIRHLDCSAKKTREIVGIAMVRRTERYLFKESLSTNKPYARKDLTYLTLDDEEQPLLSTRETVPKLHRLKQIGQEMQKYLTSSKNRTRKYNTLSPNIKPNLADRNHTWWTKFYHSIERSDTTAIDDIRLSPKHSLRVYDAELESQPEFGYFRDWADQVSLVAQSKTKKSSSKESYADLKFDVKIKNTAESFSLNSLTKAQKLLDLITEKPITVIVFVVQGLNLRPMDGLGNSDAYLQVEFGSEKINNRHDFIPNQTNPIFGRRFVLNGVLPRDNILQVSVFDYDDGLSFSDDLIGSTTIDVEDRLRSRHRAFAGVSEEYCQSGYNAWRWSDSPSQILCKLCDRHGLDHPVLVGNRLLVNGVTYTDKTKLCLDEPLIERLSLSVLHTLPSIPAFGYALVPEHVETRSLYHPDRPGLEQGKIQLWIEIVDPRERNRAHLDRPLLDITPMPPRRFELRVIVWNTSDVILDETNIFGKRMSDIYVKGWLESVQEAQCTDVHYRSLTGEAQFNWRMVFPVVYAEAEDVMVVTKAKSFFGQSDTLVKRPATLNVQIWDNDAISFDDFLGSTTILLSNFEMPAESAAKCRWKEKPSGQLSVPMNLFTLSHSIRGWFPVKGLLANGKMGQTGKVELELEVQPSDLCSAVGLGRDGPQALPTPNRPDTSFGWFSNPMKSLRHIVVPQLKRVLRWICIGGAAILVLVVLVLLIFSQSMR